MKVCDVCGTALGLIKFRCADGVVCKDCYEIASVNCTETIRQKSLDEIKILCQQGEKPILEEVFETTRRVANYILFDDTHKKICIPNNRAILKGHHPEIHSYNDIIAVSLKTEPLFSVTQLDALDGKKDNTILRKMEIEIKIKGKQNAATVPVINSAVRTKSYAFHRSYIFAKRILTALEKLGGKNPV